MQYTVQAAARATGVGESRLRTWERRYGIPSPRRSATGRRLYDEADLRVIRRMAALVDAGLSAAQAADAVRAEEPLEAPAPTPPAVPPHPAIATLVAAAGRFDEAGVTEAVDAAVAALGWRDALARAVFPALRALGAEWERGALTPAQEHFASELVRARLAAAVAAAPPPAAGAATVLLACPEDERHDLGLAGMWLLLRRAGARVCYLGADVPTAALVAAAERVRPDAICLAATARAARPMLAAAARAVIASRLPALLFVGGAAVDAAGSTLDAPGVRLPTAPGAAVDFVLERLAAASR